MVKKRLPLLFVLILSLSMVLVACGPDREGKTKDGGTSDDSSEVEKPEKLLVWADENKAEGIKDAVKAFEEKHGIKIKVKELEMASKQKEQLRLDGPAGTGPDVLTLPHDQIGLLAKEGLLAPIDVKQSVLDIYTDSSIDAVTYEGDVYGVPKATETPVLFYNKELLKEAPKTFEELYTFSKKFTKDGKYGFLALWDNYYFAHGILASYGAYVFENNDGTLDTSSIGLNNEGAIKGAKFIEKWYDEGLFPQGIVGENGGSALTGLFEGGKAAATMQGPWAVQGMKDAGIDFGVSPMPKLPNGEYAKTFVGVKSWNVSSYSEHKEWATKLIVWLANEKNSKERFKIVNEIPPVKSLINDPVIEDNPVAKAVAIQSQRGVPMPNIPEMGKVWEPMATSLQLIVTDKQEPEDALNNAVESIKTKIKANNN
ncbi:extracellular solute-binding protein [Virgibacillus siamensis]|uniref:Maltodextrin-binding protein n=1 Tax=Virgibacillus siamensis TaxID=480071 RepID=A0ABN1GED6_9BACI